MTNHPTKHWALVLGASSGFGGATAIELARSGFNIFGVHLDRSSTFPNAEGVVKDITSLGREAIFFNVNAADAEKRTMVLDKMSDHMTGGSSVRVLLHSIAFGSLKPFIANGQERATQKQMDMTLDVMANSLIYWVQELVERGFLGRGGRVFAMTSSGSRRVWSTYGPVSAAKAALESHVRQLALELAPKGVTVNAIRAGVTNTAALRKIPGHEQMITMAQTRNPSGRLTTPEDVAQAIALLSEERSHWITGNVIGVDGGEDIVG